MYLDIHDETTIKIDMEIDIDKKEVVLCVLEISEPLTTANLMEALNELNRLEQWRDFRIVKIKHKKAQGLVVNLVMKIKKVFRGRKRK